MEAWDNHILITNMAPGTIPFYLKTGLFNPPVYKEGFRGYLQFNFSEILPPKKEIFRKSIPLLKVADFLLNMVNGVRLLFYRGYGFSGNFRIDYQDGISREAAGFIPDQYQDEYCRRGKEELEWILQDPWLAEEDIHHHRESRYYFSSVVKRFVRQVVEFSSGDGTLSAFLILNIRDNHLTVPYFYGKEEALRDVVNFLFNTMLDYQLNMLTIFNGSLVKQLWKSSSPFAFRRKIIRPYVFPKSLNIQLPAFQDGDGDSVFT